MSDPAELTGPALWRGQLEPERLADNEFLKRSPGHAGRLFAAPVMAWALVAAGRTVDEGRVASLHAFFLRPGDLLEDVRLVVERVRTGRRFSTRQVTAFQAGKEILRTVITFTNVSEGPFEHSQPPPGAPDPETLGDWMGRVRAQLPSERQRTWRETPLWELRSAGSEAGQVREGELPWRTTWLRPASEPPEDPLLRAAAVVQATDTALLATVGSHYSLVGRSTSLDHAVWFYDVPRLEGWLLYVSESPAARHSRALTTARIYDREGRVIAAVAQEALFLAPRGPLATRDE